MVEEAIVNANRAVNSDRKGKKASAQEHAKQGEDELRIVGPGLALEIPNARSPQLRDYPLSKISFQTVNGLQQLHCFKYEFYINFYKKFPRFFRTLHMFSPKILRNFGKSSKF